MNKVCGTHFPSHMGARSCTRTLQVGTTRRHSITVIDTPGFYASEDIAAHVAAQKYALEGIALSGIYVVVKYARADEIAELLQKVMNFVGDDDLRIIITHSDVVRDQEEYSETEMISSLSSLLDVDARNIAIFGTDTCALTVEGFINSTMHPPKKFVISAEQIALIASLGLGSRKLAKAIDQIYAKIEAASKECHDLARCEKCYETDIAVIALQNVTIDEVRAAKENVFRGAEDLTEQQQNLVYGKAGLHLTLRLQEFIDATNKCLSWDVTNAADPRNIYRSCNYCGAVFNKTEGCDGDTICGAVPRDFRRPRPRFLAQFLLEENSWVVQFFLDGRKVLSHYVRSKLAAQNIAAVEWGGRTNHIKREGAMIESGCGATIRWSSMVPVCPSRLESLGFVELERPGEFEELSRVKFDDRVREHEQRNEGIIRENLGHEASR